MKKKNFPQHKIAARSPLDRHSFCLLLFEDKTRFVVETMITNDNKNRNVLLAIHERHLVSLNRALSDVSDQVFMELAQERRLREKDERAQLKRKERLKLLYSKNRRERQEALNNDAHIPSLCKLREVDLDERWWGAPRSSPTITSANHTNHTNHANHTNHTFAAASLSMATSATSNLTTLLSCDDHKEKMISIDSIEACARRETEAVTTLSAYEVSTLTTKDQLTIHYFQNELPNLLLDVPVRTGKFELLPSQRLAILVLTQAIPYEVETSLKVRDYHLRRIRKLKTSEVHTFERRARVPASRFPTFVLVDLATGVGKTIITSIATMLSLVDGQRWANMQQIHEERICDRMRNPSSGIIMTDHSMPSERSLARLAIVLVPPPLLSHWSDQLEDAKLALEYIVANIHLDKVVIWIDGDKGGDDSSSYGKPSVETALELTKKDIATLWVLPTGHDAWTKMMERPDIDFGVLVWDELKDSRPRQMTHAKRSLPIHNIVLQATTGNLANAFDGDKEHPFRQFLGGQLKDLRQFSNTLANNKWIEASTMMEQAALISSALIPPFLHKLLSADARPLLPSGLIVHSVEVSHSTIIGAMTGDTFAQMSLLAYITANTTDQKIIDRFSRVLVKPREPAYLLEQFAIILEEAEEDVAHHRQGEPPEREEAFGRHRHNLTVVKRLNERLKTALELMLPKEANNAHCAGANNSNSNGSIANGPNRQLGPICPIMMEPIPAEQVVVMVCCGSLQNRNLLHKMPENKCPLCRHVIENVICVADSICQSSGGGGDGGGDDGGNGGGNGKRRCISLDDHLREISMQRLPIITALRQLLLKMIKEKSDLRVLLSITLHGDTNMEALRQHLSAVNELQVVQIYRSMNTKKIAQVTNRFNFVDGCGNEKPMLIVVDASEASTTSAGLDLFATDVTILTSVATTATMQQLIGRCLRIRPTTNAKKWPAKRLITLKV